MKQELKRICDEAETRRKLELTLAVERVWNVFAIYLNMFYAVSNEKYMSSIAIIVCWLVLY